MKLVAMNKQYALSIVLTLAVFTGFSQRTTVHKTTASRTDQVFIQDAINSNNEAITLAQMAVRQSKTAEVRQIARQILLDHAAAQKKLYAMAHLKDSVSMGRLPAQQSAARLPQSDNLKSRRNSTVVSMGSGGSSNASSVAGTSTTATAASNTAANSVATSTRRAADTASGFGRNQTFNGNTSIDNANGTNNPVRTEIGAASGRWTENTTVINNQPVAVAAQPVASGVTAPAINGDVTNGTAVVNGTPVNTIDNVPTFPNRQQEVVRISGQTVGFENPGTNLSFPANPRYASTTPNMPANGNAGSDYGVQGGQVNNVQTNALNTAPYANNEINANIVQTGQQQGTYNPTAVINSSTTSMNNNQVAFNNANANRANDIPVQARPAGTVVTNPSGRNVAATNSVGRNTVVAADSTNAPANTAPTLVGRLAGRRSSGNNTSGGTPNAGTIATVPAASAFYTTPNALTTGVTTLQNTQPAAFDREWLNQLLLNQQTATQHYQAALKSTHQPGIRTYINTTLPLLQGHQYALKQWKMKQ